MRIDYNAPENWSKWLRSCMKDPSSPMQLPRSLLAALTGQDARALRAIAACWGLYASSDEDGRRGALAAIQALLPAMQPQCRPFARELIAQQLDWSDRERLWPLVESLPAVGCKRKTVADVNIREGRAQQWHASDGTCFTFGGDLDGTIRVGDDSLWVAVEAAPVLEFVDWLQRPVDDSTRACDQDSSHSACIIHPAEFGSECEPGDKPCE